jgi:short-subunit dehydrogenase
MCGQQCDGDGVRAGVVADPRGVPARHGGYLSRSGAWHDGRVEAHAHTDHGTIINVGSARSYRAIPLQSIDCYAVRGFTDALRSEPLHDGVAVHLTMVHLAAMNMPQFDWALNKMRYRPPPGPQSFRPRAARAILFASTHRRREVWVGFPTVEAILAG